MAEIKMRRSQDQQMVELNEPVGKMFGETLVEEPSVFSEKWFVFGDWDPHQSDKNKCYLQYTFNTE